MIFTRQCKDCMACKPEAEFYPGMPRCRKCELAHRRSRGGGKPSQWRKDDPLNIAAAEWIRTS